MASLYRLDVIVRGNSDVTQDYAVKWTKDWVNKRQEADENKDENGEYIKEYYADLFDARSKKAWKVFSDVATQNREIEDSYTKEDGEVISGVIYLTSYIEDVENMQKTIDEIKITISEDNAEIL